MEFGLAAWTGWAGALGANAKRANTAAMNHRNAIAPQRFGVMEHHMAPPGPFATAILTSQLLSSFHRFGPRIHLFEFRIDGASHLADILVGKAADPPRQWVAGIRSLVDRYGHTAILLQPI